ncbi:alpha/beta hydrolase [Brachybacterium phenoliresistens]|uniref:Alpha/beta hydrolase n=1 Tax=Brachybacterium phenoliresistens TaxID=396014 RepID=Z9JV25_9MICO|nr:alpha/beta hydrolase [Brachybacterium phenoliresistens]EWS81617.1 alpha/beta hydrolase [Brachybacterium phenoliresistens]
MSDARAAETTPDLPVPPAPEDLAPARAAGRGLRLLSALPDTPYRLALRASQRPTLPGRDVVDRALVTREVTRIGDRTVPGVPVTWIDRDRARQAAVIHLHGGAHTIGETPAHWRWLEELRRRAGTAAAMVHYRMPPGHPFPRALEDAAGVVAELVREAELTPGRWILSGDSSGGGLALAVAQRLRDEGHGAPAALLLTSPWTDLTLSDPVIALQAGRDEVLTPQALERAGRLYAGQYVRTDPRLSPRFGGFHGLPPVHLVAGGDDILLGDARAAHASLADAGVPVEYHEQVGAPHDYPILIQGPSAQWALRRQIAFVRRICGLGQQAPQDAHAGDHA